VKAGAKLRRLEAIVDRAGIAPRIEALLPVGARRRQLSVRTLLIGMLAVACDGRPAHLSRVHEALCALPEADRRRLGVIAAWRDGPHELTYRQVERTFGLVVRALAKAEPDGEPSEALSEIVDALLEASVEPCGDPETSSYAVDWTDLETFSCPPPKGGGRRGDPEAAWGRRRGNSPGERDEAFYGYYLQVVTAVGEERGPAVAELVRRIHIAGCKADPPAALVPVLGRMAAAGIELGDVLADTGYAHRTAETWALPVRRLGARLVQDLHPHDRGPKGTHMGAIRANGALYCPATPAALLELGPLHRGATEAETAAHDQKAAELRRYRLAPIAGYDADGYHRVGCPAARGKLRCPLRPESMALGPTRPEVADPPEHPPTCCAQRTITVPPEVNAKTAQKHDYPSPSHRRSYARRSAAERAYATLKDPASNDLSRGWCRLTGLAPIALFAASAFVARNLRVVDAFAVRMAEEERRAANGLPPRRRRRRRKSASDLIGAANGPP
jgi:hypothetical protein